MIETDICATVPLVMSSNGSLTDWVVAIATVIALVFAAWQLRANAKSAGQSHAREAWMLYLQLGLQNPDLSTVKFAMKSLKMGSVHELISGGVIGSERYLWFLSVMLEACESLIEYFPSDHWIETIKFNLSLHQEAIRLLWQREACFYSEALCDIVQEFLTETQKVECIAPISVESTLHDDDSQHDRDREK